MSEHEVWGFLAWWVPRVTGVLIVALGVDGVLRWCRVRRWGALMWKGVIVVAVLAPVVSLVLPAIEVEVPFGHAARAVPEAGVDESMVSAVLPVSPGGAGAVVLEAGGTRGLVEWVIAVWLCGVSVFGVRWVLGLAGVWRMRRHARRIDWGAVSVVQGLVVYESLEVDSPVLVGVLRPVVLVPEGSEVWTAERRRMVVLHERAHVVGGDVFFNVLVGALCAVQWFNPLIWIARRRLRDWQEWAADDAVLNGGGDARGYARFLVELAAGGAGRGRVPMVAAAMARPGGIEERVEAILAWSGASGGGVWTRGFTVGVLGMVLLGISIGVEAKDVEVAAEAASEDAADGALHTRTFRVPPDFLSWGKEKRATAIEVLQDLGVKLPEQSGVVYVARDSTLVVRTTARGMEAVEEAVEVKVGDVSRQTQIQLRAKVFDVENGMIELGKVGLPTSDAVPEKAGDYALAAVLTDPQVQQVFRALAEAAVATEALPLVYARSGNKTKVAMQPSLDLELVGDVSRDGRTIEYELEFNNGSALGVTIWDGQTLGFVTKRAAGGLRYLFLTSFLVDPAGRRVAGEDRSVQGAVESASGIAGKLERIVVPHLSFDQATLGEAVAFLRLKSAELDVSEEDPKKRGVNLIVKENGEDGVDGVDEAVERRVTLDLRDVPLGVALKYVCELARFERKVEPYGVVLTAKPQ